MTLYLDASALVKRYIAEDGSDIVVEAMRGASAWAMCRIGFVETFRAIGRAGDRRDLRKFEEDWPSVSVIELDQELAAGATHLALESGLRTLDALHLAAALAHPADDLTLATWDIRLHRAAHEHGLNLLPEALD